MPAPDYLSNYNAFITQLTELTQSSNSASALNTFWEELIATGNFPFAIGTKVAFLYRGNANKVTWAGEFNNWNVDADAGRRLGVSDIWLLEKEFPADARSGYKMVVNGSVWLADPNNPHPQTPQYGNSELWMPSYVIPPETLPRSGIAKGTLTDNLLKESTYLNYKSQYRVYTPAGYSQMAHLPTIYVADGQEYMDDLIGKMAIVLDNLIADKIIEPVIAVFLDPRNPDNLGNNRRGDEYRNNSNFVNYVTKELIPEIDAAYKTKPSADARAMMGASYGGYNAAYFCAKANDYFKMIGMNSPYLHPVGDYTIDNDLRAISYDGMKLYLSYGTFDAQGEQYFYRLKSIFDQKGSDYRYGIIGDGHTWENWSRVLSPALDYFFAFSEATTPVVTDIPNQRINKGAHFEAINLGDFVSHIDYADAELTWTTNGSQALKVSIDKNGLATVTMPNAEWVGSETITFIATDPKGASSEDDVTFTAVDPSGISDVFSDDMFLVYPNPASQSVFISSPEVADLSIINMSGQLIRAQGHVVKARIDVSALNKGVYFIQFACENRVVIKKILIE